jgi:hypothetical protein
MIPPTRVRIEVKYGRDRGRRLAAIQCGPVGQLMFRQVLLSVSQVSLDQAGFLNFYEPEVLLNVA